jgi:hypothetical protein
MQTPASLFQNTSIRMFSEENKPEDGEGEVQEQKEYVKREPVEDLHKYSDLG